MVLKTNSQGFIMMQLCCLRIYLTFIMKLESQNDPQNTNLRLSKTAWHQAVRRQPDTKQSKTAWHQTVQDSLTPSSPKTAWHQTVQDSLTPNSPRQPDTKQSDTAWHQTVQDSLTPNSPRQPNTKQNKITCLFTLKNCVQTFFLKRAILQMLSIIDNNR